MRKTINNELIRKFNPCYDPKEIIKNEKEYLKISKWISKYRAKVKKPNEIIWLLCRGEFMSDKDMRLFAVWCAREAIKSQKLVDERSLNAIDIAEKFANGEASVENLSAARSAARSAAWSARSAAGAAAEAAACAAACAAASAAAIEKQIDKLITYFY